MRRHAPRRGGEYRAHIQLRTMCEKCDSLGEFLSIQRPAEWAQKAALHRFEGVVFNRRHGQRGNAQTPSKSFGWPIGKIYMPRMQELP